MTTEWKVGDRVILLDAPQDVREQHKQEPCGADEWVGKKGRITTVGEAGVQIHLDEDLDVNDFGWIENDFWYKTDWLHNVQAEKVPESEVAAALASIQDTARKKMT